MQITSGSFSRLDDFYSCELKAFYKYVEKIPEPDRGPPPAGKKEWPNDRGSRIHDSAQEFVEGKADIIKELGGFSTDLFLAREMYAQKKATTEEMWCFDKNWKPCKETERKKTKFRIKIDLTIHLSPTHRLVVDYKTGKRFYNEIKHAKQCQTYAIGQFLREPKVQKVTTELWYTDLPNEPTHPSVLTRSQGVYLLQSLNSRLQKMFETTSFRPKPSKSNCKFCPYNGKHGEQICKHAVV